MADGRGPQQETECAEPRVAREGSSGTRITSALSKRAERSELQFNGRRSLPAHAVTQAAARDRRRAFVEGPGTRVPQREFVEVHPINAGRLATQNIAPRNGRELDRGILSRRPERSAAWPRSCDGLFDLPETTPSAVPPEGQGEARRTWLLCVTQ